MDTGRGRGGSKCGSKYVLEARKSKSETQSFLGKVKLLLVGQLLAHLLSRSTGVSVV